MKGIVKEAIRLPSYMVDFFAGECGVKSADPNALMELQAILLEEIIDNDVDTDNIFSAFIMVRDKVTRRFNDWMDGYFSHASDV